MKSTTYKEPWKTITQKRPPILWDAKTKTFSIFLENLLKNKKLLRKGRDSIQAEFSPPITYVARIKEAGATNWIIGIETPLTECTFCELKPNTEYEVEIRAKNEHGESEPASAKVKTGGDGVLVS